MIVTQKPDLILFFNFKYSSEPSKLAHEMLVWKMKKVYLTHCDETYLILESTGAESPDAGEHEVYLVPLLGTVWGHIVGGKERLQ